jgi:hypothetical protein
MLAKSTTDPLNTRVRARRIVQKSCSSQTRVRNEDLAIFEVLGLIFLVYGANITWSGRWNDNHSGIINA